MVALHHPQEQMQLSEIQQMCLVEEALSLFAKQRAQSAQRSSLTGSVVQVSLCPRCSTVSSTSRIYAAAPDNLDMY